MGWTTGGVPKVPTIADLPAVGSEGQVFYVTGELAFYSWDTLLLTWVPANSTTGAFTVNGLTNPDQEINLADPTQYEVVADEAGRLALTTPFPRIVSQTDTGELWYWTTLWEKIEGQPVIIHYVDGSSVARHEILLPDYELLKILGDIIYEIEI